MLEIRVEKIIAVDPMQVWETLVDHERLDKWMNFDKVVRVRPGSPDPNGAGAVRRMLRGPQVMEERITRFEPGKRLDYDVVRGAPGINPHGRVTLSSTKDGGTLVWWRIWLHPYIPGTSWAIKAFLTRSLERSLEGLRERLEPELLLATLDTRPTSSIISSTAAKVKRVIPGRARPTRETTSDL